MACLLEVMARKPGNVHRYRDLPGLRFDEFLLSATAIRQPMECAFKRGVGTTVLAAVEATRQVVATNTNLGIILLLAPLAAIPGGHELAEGVEKVLAATTVDDARQVFQAIRIAQPGGLGRVAEQDVADEPTVTLRAAMALAADRDLVARQYAGGFREVLREALPMLAQALDDGHGLETGIVLSFLDLLARHPDSLIVRKAGPEAARLVSLKAGEVLAAGWPDDAEGRRRLDEYDLWLRSPDVALNPGTTADLVTAALFAALRDGTIQLPRLPGSSDSFAQ
jgi:triphosphoribosyl-dephospho-CoA synthase